MNTIWQDINWTPSIKERRKFGLILMVGFPIVGCIWLGMLRIFSGQWHPGVFYGFAAVGLSFGTFVALLPQYSRYIYCGWHCVTKLIEFTISYVLLAVLYFTIITPIGLTKRKRPDNPIKKGFDKSKTTYWRDVAKTTKLSQYYRQF